MRRKFCNLVRKMEGKKRCKRYVHKWEEHTLKETKEIMRENVDLVQPVLCRVKRLAATNMEISLKIPQKKGKFFTI
jgi:hypothetical protein